MLVLSQLVTVVQFAPWRVWQANVLDCVFCFALLVLLSVAAFFAEFDIETESKPVALFAAVV